MSTLTVSAISRPGNSTSNSGSSNGGSGVGGVSSGGNTASGSVSGTLTTPDGSGEFSGVIKWPYEEYTTYTPKATILYSANAILANEGAEAVYFLPQIDDFPTNIAETVTDLTDGSGTRHRFALVYDGAFDTDVVYTSPSTINSGEEKNSRLLTSKKVYSLEENSRLLNILGYDLLLSKEAVTMTVDDATGDILFAYNATRLSENTPLNAETCIMDLYKAMGVYEWDISFAYGKDTSFDINESPLLKQVSFLTGKEGTDGIDVSEICTYVGATRTNPDLYWERSNRDILFDGGAHNITSGDYLGSEVSVARTYSRNDTVTLGEFCALARAIMTLYGEPIITDMERDACLKLYGVVIPEGNYTEEVYESILYLAAKGIIDPEFKDFNTRVTFKDIEEILLRIADEGSRLTIKEPEVCALSRENFVPVERVALAGNGNMLYTSSSDDVQYKDYLVEIVPDFNDFRVVKKMVSNTPIIPPGTNTTTTQAPTVGLPVTQTVGQPVFSTRGLQINGKAEATGVWINAGIETINDIQYYHFKISDSLFEGVDNHTLTISYVLAEDEEWPNAQYHTTYWITNCYPGLYNFDNIDYEKYDADITFTSFEDAGFTYQYRDDDTELFSSWTFNASSNLYAITVSSTELDAALKDYAHSDAGYNWSALEGTDRNRVTIADNVWACLLPIGDDNGETFWRLEIYTTDTYSKVYNTTFLTHILKGSSNAEEGFYRADDNTLMVSVNSLKSRGLVRDFTDLGANTWLMSVKSADAITNVVIHDGEDNQPNFIMVGDTLYPVTKGEPLFREVDNEPYVNYKATTGWAFDAVLVPTGSTGVVYAANKKMLSDFFGTNSAVNWNSDITTEDITTFFSKNSMKVMVNASLFNDTQPIGIALTSSYPLANYIVVASDVNGQDDLFVYYMRTSDNKAQEDSWDTEARNAFTELTGYSLGASTYYYMRHYVLNQDEHTPTKNSLSKVDHVSGSVSGMTNVGVNMIVAGRNLRYTYGWYYDPPVFGTIKEGIDAWANGELVLPFFIQNGTVYNANVNRMVYVPDGSLLQQGWLPSYFGQQNRNTKDGYVELTYTGTTSVVDKEDSPFKDYNMSDISVVAAPAGNFAIFKTGVEKKVSDIGGAGDIYYGTSKVRYMSRNDKIQTSSTGTMPDANGDTKAVRTFYGQGNSSVFVLELESTTTTYLPDSDDDVDISMDAVFNNAADLVDWNQFSFHVLVTHLDQWTSILLIFVLNVLPRVCMFLCFILMTLSLLKTWQPWVNFCNNHFDIYKALTLGHLNVNVIELKKLFIYCMICFVFFYMICDGVLFNVIIWFCRWFINLYQR